MTLLLIVAGLIMDLGWQAGTQVHHVGGIVLTIGIVLFVIEFIWWILVILGVARAYKR